ncbi:MAG TPA: EamA family transporter, partial [Burkholderiaceae bacterium]
ALAYLQVTALGRAGEPELRTVFYFSAGTVTVGAGATLILHASGIGSWHPHEGHGLALLVGVGLLATAAQLLLTRAYAYGKPLVNASLQYLGIVYAAGFGVLLFGDHLTLGGIAGIVCIIIAGLAATLLRTRATPIDTQHSVNES